MENIWISQNPHTKKLKHWENMKPQHIIALHIFFTKMILIEQNISENFETKIRSSKTN